MENIKDTKIMPERKKTFKIENNTYDVEFFTTGQLIEIEILKAQLSRNMYSGITDNGTIVGNYSRMLIDMISTLNVLIPQLKKDMNVKTISELNALDSKKLLKIYIKEIFPWISDWMEILNADDDDEDKNEQKNE